MKAEAKCNLQKLKVRQEPKENSGVKDLIIKKLHPDLFICTAKQKDSWISSESATEDTGIQKEKFEPLQNELQLVQSQMINTEYLIVVGEDVQMKQVESQKVFGDLSRSEPNDSWKGARQSKLQMRRLYKDRLNKFDRGGISERLASVKKLRSVSKAQEDCLENFRQVLENEKLKESQRTNADTSKSMLSKVKFTRNVIPRRDYE